MSRCGLMAIAFVLLGLMGWVAQRESPQPVPATLAAVAPELKAAELPASSSGIQTSVAPMRAAERAPATPDPRLAADWETSAAGRLEGREWCTQAVRRARMDEEARRRAEQQPGLVHPEFEPDEVMERAQARSLLRWVRQLQADGDEAALALADFLLAVGPLEQGGARERLVQRAQQSSQGLVISLAMQR